MRSLNCDMYGPLLHRKILDLGWGGFNIGGGALITRGRDCFSRSVAQEQSLGWGHRTSDRALPGR